MIIRSGTVLACIVLLAATGPAAASAHRTADACAANADEGDVATCEAAVAEYPGDPAVWRDLARARIAVGDYDGAADAQQEVTHLEPENPRAHYDLAGTLGFVRRYAEAVAPVEAALSLRPDYPEALMLAAIIYHSLDRETESFGMTLRAAELGDIAAMFDLVWHYEHGKGVSANPRQAFLWAERAAEAGHVGAMDLMVEIYLEGRFTEPPDDSKAEDWAMRARRARTAE